MTPYSAPAKYDWADLGKIALEHAKPLAVWIVIIWWFGFPAVAQFVLTVLGILALAFVPFLFVALVTGNR